MCEQIYHKQKFHYVSKDTESAVLDRFEAEEVIEIYGSIYLSRACDIAYSSALPNGRFRGDISRKGMRKCDNIWTLKAPFTASTDAVKIPEGAPPRKVLLEFFGCRHRENSPWL
jgi:hypothetical protein